MSDWKSPDPVALHAKFQPDRLACVDLATGRRWTYSQLDDEIQRCVSVFSVLYPINAGDRVAVVARNSADLLIIQQATMRLGAIFVPINWRLSSFEREMLLKDCDPALLILSEPITYDTAYHTKYLAEIKSEIAAAQPSLIRGSGPGDLPSIILYTSGTSGHPKGVLITERNASATAINFGVLGAVTRESVFLCDSPMFHIIGLVTSIRSPLLQGGTVLISSGFDPALTNQRLSDRSLKVTHYFCVPQMAQMLREETSFRPAEWSTLVALFTGGAPNPSKNIRWWLEQGVTMVDGYGMTEAGTILGMPPEPAIISSKAGSVGLAAPMTAIRIVTPDGTDVQPGTPGEIWVSGDNVTVGYWNRPLETAETFSADNWLRTGDIGRADIDGFITLVDRRKDMFISGGENIYPSEIESVLTSHPDVLEAAVVGVPDVKWGEVGQAFIVLRPGATLNDEAMVEHCAERLARYKIPKKFSGIEAIPRTTSGKIQKHILREICSRA